MPPLLMLLLPLVLGALAVFLLLPRPRPYPLWLGGSVAGLALVLAGWFWVRSASLSPETILFYAFSAIALTAGALLITQSQPARAALSFALVVLATTGLFLLQAAPFLMVATIIVYAGAIVVTFLFVLMLAQQEGPSDADQRSREPVLATIAGFLMMGLFVWIIQLNYDTPPATGDIQALQQLAHNANRSAEQPTFAAIEQTIGGVDDFLERYKSQLHSIQLESTGTEARMEGRLQPDAKAQLDKLKNQLETNLSNLQVDWMEWRDKNQPREMQTALQSVATSTHQLTALLTALQGNLTVPPDVLVSDFSVPPDNASTQNVAPLGRTLFTDYLVGFELAGLLLTVATIGTIAITTRREGRRP